MPINVSCGQCGQKFAAKEQLAGKKVRCPKCSNPLVIPTPQAAKPKQPQPSAEMHDLFDEAGIEATPDGGVRCPACFSPMQGGALICTKCGFNVQTGEKTEGFATAGFEESNPMFRQAEGELAEDAREKRKSVDPVPWYYYVTALLFLALNAVLFSQVWYYTLEAQAPAGFKVTYVINMLVFMLVIQIPFFLLFLSHWAIATWAFYEDSGVQCLMCTFVPLYDIIFAFKNIKIKAMKWFAGIWLVGLVWAIVILIMLYGTASLVKPELTGG